MTVVGTSRRHVDCDAAFNLRDLGGYVAADGRTTRWQVLYRADALHRVPLAAAETGRTLGWRTVLDLRTTAEVEAGAFLCDDVEVVHLPVLAEVWDAAGLDPAADAEAYLAERYREMLDEGGPAFAAAVSTMADADRLPVVFHCSAGKDRTGVLAALVLSVLGVGDEDIAADYHLSARAMEALVRWIEQDRPDLVDHMAQQPATFLSCPPEAMLRFLSELCDRHGSAAGYLTGAGVEPATLERLRSLLLEAAPSDTDAV